jgi:hypothetical protein
MTTEYVEKCILSCDSIDWDDVITDITEDHERSTTPVNTMNKADEVKGFKQGNQQYSGTITFEPHDDPRLNPHEWLRTKKRMTVIKKPNVGKTVTYFDLRLTRISDRTSAGAAGQTFNWVARRRVET